MSVRCPFWGSFGVRIAVILRGVYHELDTAVSTVILVFAEISAGLRPSVLAAEAVRLESTGDEDSGEPGVGWVPARLPYLSWLATRNGRPRARAP